MQMRPASPTLPSLSRGAPPSRWASCSQVPHPLLHHRVRVNTLQKGIGQNIGRLAHQILSDHVQNLVLVRDEVEDGKVKARDSKALLKTTPNRDTTYKWSARCTRLAPVKLQETSQGKGGTSMTCVVQPPPER